MRGGGGVIWGASSLSPHLCSIPSYSHRPPGCPPARRRAEPFTGSFPDLGPPQVASEGVAHRFKAALEAAEAVMAGYHNSPDAGVAGGEQGGVGALLAGLAGVQTLADAGFSCPAVLR